MLTAEYLEKLQEWRSQGDRSVEIEIDRRGNLKIWAYDYTFMNGQHIESGEIPDIDGKVAKLEKKEYERLKAKFGEVAA